MSESLINIKTEILSLIKDLISGNFKNKNNEIIITWTDYFIKGIKICSKVTEAESLSKLLIDNEIISIDGELNKKNILDLRNLNQIKIKDFPIKLKLNLKNNYNELKSQINQKICKAINFNPKKLIIEMISKTENNISIKIKEEIQTVTKKYSNIFKSGIDLILHKENECKKLIKDEINIYLKKLLFGTIDILNNLKKTIKVKSNDISNETKNLYNSIWDKINNIEEMVNVSLKENITSLVNKIFGNFELIKNLKEKLDLNIIIDTIKKTSEKIYNIILDLIKIFSTQINQSLMTFKNYTGIDGQNINKKITDLLNSFLYRFNNDIKPFSDYIKNIEIEYNEIDINKFLIEKIYSPINLLPIMNEIKEKKKILDELLININSKKDEIINNIDYLILYIQKIFDSIENNITSLLNNLFQPCDNFITKLGKISDEIQNKINTIIFPVISPIIKDYLDKVTSYYFKLISKLIGKIDTIGNNLIDNIENANNQLIQYEQKAVNIAEIGFTNMKSALKKINFYKEETLFLEFTSLCKDIKDYDEREVEMDIITELCSNIITEFKKMIKDCIKESELCTLLEKDYNSFIKELNLN